MKSQPFLALTLALVLPLPPGAAARKPPAPPARDAKLFQTKLSKEASILLALDRLTFGPRPGDVEYVNRVGLKTWIDQQLHPERIPEDRELDALLAPLASLYMTPLEVAQHYPPPQMIKAIADGRQPMPGDPILRASIQRYIARFRAKAKKEDGDPKSDRLEDLEPARPLDEILTPPQIAVLRTGKPEERKALLASLTPAGRDDLVIAMPKGLRQQILSVAPTDLRRKILQLNAPQQVVAYDLVESKLMRAIYSRRQLAEELDDFWFNHFNVFYEKGSDRFLIPSYERDAIRPHVLGKFRDLLGATAKSPAMLFYLDNFESVRPDLDAADKQRKVKRGLNENYGRELMELHTLGVNGGYTQKDVTEVARCFTGWTLRAPRMGGGFFFNGKLHDQGEKVVLGHRIPAGGGIEDGEKVLDLLARHPSTARFISRELAQRFVADEPPQALVDRMAQTFLAKDGDIREVLKTMLASREFWSQGSYRAKIKTPFEMAVSAARALNAEVEDGYALANQIAQLGEPLYRKQEPTGYSNLNAEWVNSSALVARMNFALLLAQNKVPGVKVDTARFAGGETSEVAQQLLLRDVSPQTRATIEKAVAEKQAEKGGPPRNALVAGLVLGSPEFQRR